MNKTAIALREKADGKTHVVINPSKYGADKFLSEGMARLEAEITGWGIQGIDEYINEQERGGQ